MEIARAVSRRSDCERARVGAVVVKDRRIRGTGYNGSPAGHAGCISCPRRTSDVSPGSSYDNCIAVHAEANALLYCDREDLIGATLYVTRQPCYACSKLIDAAGIEAVVWPGQCFYHGRWCEADCGRRDLRNRIADALDGVRHGATNLEIADMVIAELELSDE